MGAMNLSEIFTIVFSVVYIVEYSGFIQSLSKWLWEIRGNGNWSGQLIRKPFSCSVCLSFWLVLIYLLKNEQSIILSIGVAVIASISSVLINRLMGVLFRLINRIY